MRLRSRSRSAAQTTRNSQQFSTQFRSSITSCSHWWLWWYCECVRGWTHTLSYNCSDAALWTHNKLTPLTTQHTTDKLLYQLSSSLYSSHPQHHYYIVVSVSVTSLPIIDLQSLIVRSVVSMCDFCAKVDANWNNWRISLQLNWTLNFVLLTDVKWRNAKSNPWQSSVIV